MDKISLENYISLLKLNPQIKKVRQLSISNGLDDYSGIPHDKNCTYFNTLIFKGKTRESLVIGDNKYSIDYYEIVFAVGRSPDEQYFAPITYCYQCQKNRNGCYKCNVRYDVCNFYDNFFTFDPKIKIVNCDDYSCRKHNDIKKNGIWCYLCREHCPYHPLELIIHDSMDFSDFPSKSILCIKHYSQPIDIKKDKDLSDVIRLLDKEISYATKLQISIDNEKNNLNEKAKMQIRLYKYLEKYGGSIDTMKILLKNLFEKSDLYQIVSRHISFKS